jgi:hypothetical protein
MGVETETTETKTENKMSKKSKKCEAMQFSKDATNDAICAALKKEWKKRYIGADGTPKANRWAPIYAVRGENEKLSFRLDGTKLILSGEIAQISAFKKKVTYS